MNKLLKFFLIFSALPNIISLLFANYLYQSFYGSFKNNQVWNYTLYLKESVGIILYAIDSREVPLAVEITQGNTGEQDIYVHFNGRFLQRKLRVLCNCSYCYETNMQFTFAFQRKKLSIKCNNNSEFSQVRNSRTGRFNQFPKPKDFRKRPSKIYTWMGNIGPYYGYRNKLYNPIRNQLIGCLKSFYVGNTIITFLQYGEKFASDCMKSLRRSICSINNCSELPNITIHIFDCSMWMSDERYCRKELTNFTGILRSYFFNDLSNATNSVRLLWRSPTVSGYCLVELLFRDRHSILIYVNDINELIVYDAINYHSKNFGNISLNAINVLLLNVIDDNLILKVLRGNIIYTLVIRFLSEPFFINFGFSQFKNICSVFEGEIDFQRGSIHHNEFISRNGSLNIISKDEINSNDMVTKTLQFDQSNHESASPGSIIAVIASVTILLGVLVGIFCWKYKIVKRERPTSNIYECQSTGEINSAMSIEDFQENPSPYERIQ